MQYDAIVIGGSFAGLSAATYLARAKLSVLVIDAGKPRNRFAHESHGFLTQDGSPPAAILNMARSQVTVYREVTLRQALATHAAQHDDGFRVEIEGGETATAKSLVLATGVSDRLPDIPGIAERWGKTIAHCPYCHGYEFGGRPLGVLATSAMSLHQGVLIPEWGPVTYFVDGHDLDADGAAKLEARGVTIETTPVAAIEGEATVRLTDGRVVLLAGLFLGPQLSMAAPFAEQLGCAFDETPMGSFVKTDGFKQTTVSGVYAIGDMARAQHAVAFAVADGVLAATAIHRSRIRGF